MWHLYQLCGVKVLKLYIDQTSCSYHSVYIIVSAELQLQQHVFFYKLSSYADPFQVLSCSSYFLADVILSYCTLTRPPKLSWQSLHPSLYPTLHDVSNVFTILLSLRCKENETLTYQLVVYFYLCKDTRSSHDACFLFFSHMSWSL